MAKKDDLFKRAKARIDEAKEVYRDQHQRVREDLRFSNPAEPEQWTESDKALRAGRPTLTLDRTNQFIAQVVNDARQSNPGVQVIAVDDKADPKAAETLSGLIRHIEYRSRASQAYDMALELAARVGQGWLLVRPEVVNAATNEQEITVYRVVDPNAAGLDPNSQEADGRDAEWGWVETQVHEDAFKRMHPKAKAVPFGEAGWYADKFITICEYFERENYEENAIQYVDENGNEAVATEEEYWKLAQDLGMTPQPLGTIKKQCHRVRWVKMTGSEVLEETEFPSQYLPLVPVYGYELWSEGRRYVCGLTRRLMDGQRLHNYQMSAMAEFLGSQPKAPFILPAEGVTGWENEWKKLDKGSPSFLPYNHVDDQGNAIPAPSRIAPPTMPGAFAQFAQMASQEMEAAVGMYKANLGQQGNETSGRAIRARQMEGDTATFHFIDNLGRAIEQLARVMLDMIPRLYDTKRIKHIVGIDGSRNRVQIDPKMPQAARADGRGKVVAINPTVGAYDVRVKAGPSYTTLREEVSAELGEMMGRNPALAVALMPMWAQMRDMPEADKIKKVMIALAPPPVQQAYAEEAEDIPPQIAAQMQQMTGQMQEMGNLLQQASQRIAELEMEAQAKQAELLLKAGELEVREFDAQTKRIQVLTPAADPQQVAQLAAQMILQAQQREPLQGGEETEHLIQARAGLPDADPYGPGLEVSPDEPPEMMEPTEPLEAVGMEDDQGPSGPFSMPEQEG